MSVLSCHPKPYKLLDGSLPAFFLSFQRLVKQKPVRQIFFMPQNQEVMGSNPAGCWAFFRTLSCSNLISISQLCVLKQVSRGGATLLTLSSAAWSKLSLMCKWRTLRQVNCKRAETWQVGGVWSRIFHRRTLASDRLTARWATPRSKPKLL